MSKPWLGRWLLPRQEADELYFGNPVIDIFFLVWLSSFGVGLHVTAFLKIGASLFASNIGSGHFIG